MYKVLVAFTDLDDEKRCYLVGDMYPRSGYTPTEERIKALTSNANRLGTPVIEHIEEEQPEIVEQPILKIEKKRRKKNT